MKYITNFVKTEMGNGIKGGSTLTVIVEGAYVVAGGIYKDGFPIMIDQGSDMLEFKLLKRKWTVFGRKYVSIDLGEYELRINAFGDDHRGSGWKDKFVVF